MFAVPNLNYVNYILTRGCYLGPSNHKHALNVTRAFAVFYLMALPAVVFLLVTTSMTEDEGGYSVALACSIAAYVYWNIALICHAGMYLKVERAMTASLPPSSQVLSGHHTLSPGSCVSAAVYHARVQVSPFWTLGPAFYVTMATWLLHGGTIGAQFFMLPRNSSLQLGKALSD